jgi:cyanoexosortase A
LYFSFFLTVLNRSTFTLIQDPNFWLLALISGLATIYMTLVWRSGDVAHLGMSGLFWLAAGSLFWDKRTKIVVGSNLVSTVLGAIIIAYFLWQSNSLVTSPELNKDNFNGQLYFLRLSPFLAVLGVCLLASGIKNLKQYWRELTIIFAMGVPSLITHFLVDISPLTAKLSAFFLWYTGLDTVLQGDLIYVALNASQKGVIKVYEGCSGIESITYLLGLTVVGLVMFPLSRSKGWFVPILAILTGFVINAVRVSLMAILSATGNKAAFTYWHEGEGSLVFGLLAVLVFGGIYMLLLNQEENAQRSPNRRPQVALSQSSDAEWPIDLDLEGMETSSLSWLQEADSRKMDNEL